MPEEIEIDWKLKLMQILDCIGNVEGSTFDNYWDDYGVTKEEQKIINNAFDAYYPVAKEKRDQESQKFLKNHGLI